MQELVYVGNELELFQLANIWKGYLGNVLQPFMHKKVLEVGAGMGSTTGYLYNGKQEEWICLEPDPDLYNKLIRKITDKQLPACCSAVKGTIADLDQAHKFGTILYIDVIEHIEDDAKELRDAEKLLEDGGHLIVLVPAHPFLYSPFDKAIGHYRRYNKKMLKEAAPLNLVVEKLIYLDSVGLTASLVNKYFLKQSYPTRKQIHFWDKFMIRISKITDFMCRYHIGKTVIGVWRKS